MATVWCWYVCEMGHKDDAERGECPAAMSGFAFSVTDARGLSRSVSWTYELRDAYRFGSPDEARAAALLIRDMSAIAVLESGESKMRPMKLEVLASVAALAAFAHNAEFVAKRPGMTTP